MAPFGAYDTLPSDLLVQPSCWLCLLLLLLLLFVHAPHMPLPPSQLTISAFIFDRFFSQNKLILLKILLPKKAVRDLIDERSNSKHGHQKSEQVKLPITNLDTVPSILAKFFVQTKSQTHQ
jgi:hypothetical protein